MVVSARLRDTRRDTQGMKAETAMARSTRSSTLETRGARLKLPIAKKPLFVKIGPGVGLGYRRNRTAGTWVARIANGSGANWTKAIGNADDFDDADGTAILDYWQAQEKARTIGRGERGAPSAKLLIVKEALGAYQADLGTRGGDIHNVARVRGHLSQPMLDRVVALLTSRELRRWRDSLAKSLAPASVNRTTTALKAALNLAAEHDQRISNRRAWETGLAIIPDAQQSRNVILADNVVRQVVAAAYQQSEEFGLLVEVDAVTGARPSQLARLEVQDLQANRSDPRLMIPCSRKGRGRKSVTHRPVPISAALAKRLAVSASGRPAIAPLLMKPSGEPWRKSDHYRLFARAVVAAGQDTAEVTIYALRHSSIVRQLLANVPVRVVAVNHDTSVAMIERTYSRYIGDHSDALARAALLDTTEPAADKVVPLHAGR